MITPNEKTASTEHEIKSKLFYPQSHIRLYAQLLVMQHYFPELPDKTWGELVFRYFRKDPLYVGIWEELEEARTRTKTMRNFKPSQQQTAEALRALGFGRSNIAEFMSLSESAVNYHMAKKEGYRVYTNSYWRKLQLEHRSVIEADRQIDRAWNDPTW